MVCVDFEYKLCIYCCVTVWSNTSQLVIPILDTSGIDDTYPILSGFGFDTDTQ